MSLLTRPLLNLSLERGVSILTGLPFLLLTVLLTSYRDFKTDKEWEWLHNDSAYASALVFEPFEGNNAEMVVTNDWRSKVCLFNWLCSAFGNSETARLTVALLLQKGQIESTGWELCDGRYLRTTCDQAECMEVCGSGGRCARHGQSRVFHAYSALLY